MTQPKRLSAEERRAQILESALDVFADKGFSGARTREIAGRAGISETLIYQHFRNKEELYRAALEHLYSGHPMHEEMRGPMAAEDDEGLFFGIALHMLEHTRRDPRIVRLHFFQVLEARAGSPDAYHGKGGMQTVLEDYVRNRMANGAFAPGDPEFVVRLFHYTMFMAVADRQLGMLGRPLDMSDREMARALSRSFLNGLLAR